MRCEICKQRPAVVGLAKFGHEFIAVSDPDDPDYTPCCDRCKVDVYEDASREYDYNMRAQEAETPERVYFTG